VVCGGRRWRLLFNGGYLVTQAGRPVCWGDGWRRSGGLVVVGALGRVLGMDAYLSPRVFFGLPSRIELMVEGGGDSEMGFIARCDRTEWLCAL
jgi:hypothetical protein